LFGKLDSSRGERLAIDRGNVRLDGPAIPIAAAKERSNAP